MARHQIIFSLDDDEYNSLLAKQKEEKHTAVSVDVFAKTKLVEYLFPDGKHKA